MKLLKRTVLFALALSMGVTLMPALLWAQPAPIPRHIEPYLLDSGVHEGVEAEAILLFRETVGVTGVPWLRLHFSDYNLGEQSYIVITSLLDGASQRLDANGLDVWQGSSAYFNGDAVELELHVAPEETGIFVKIEQVTVGEWAEGDGPETICGSTDDRVSSVDSREGRIVPIGCTGWIVSNGAYLTAGHCTGTRMTTLEFNVPDSLGNGTIQHPGPGDQYPIIASSVVFNDDGAGAIGHDWAVFDCSPNTTTDLTAIQAQGNFFRMSRDVSTAGGTVRITGYGLDNMPTGTGGSWNSDSQTLQTHSGPYNGETYQGTSDSYHSYRADTMGGNSGGPIIRDNFTAIGIHTNGGCTTSGGNNTGTSFENNALENAINTFPGINVRYVDFVHTGSTPRNGTAMRPYGTVTEAVNAVPSGGIVSIVEGGYAKVYGNTFTAGADGKSMLFEAPVGTVTIGY
jgi:V8-like Glu-specific endopeptidase